MTSREKRWTFRPDEETVSIIEEIMRVRNINRTEAIQECIKLVKYWVVAKKHFEIAEKELKEAIEIFEIGIRTRVNEESYNK